jgi:hypothetical protein
MKGINGWFVDQVMKNGFYKYDPTNYHGPAPLLCPVALAEFVWPESVGDTVAGRPCEHRLCLAGFEVRAVGEPKRKPDSRAGDGDLARVRVLRALRHSRSMAAIVLDDVHLGTAWIVEIGQAELSLVCRHGTSRHDSNEGNIRHSCGVRGDCHSGSGGFDRAKSGPDLKPAKQTWTYIDLAMVIIVGAAAILFFYSGTFLNWGGVKGCTKRSKRGPRLARPVTAMKSRGIIGSN